LVIPAALSLHVDRDQVALGEQVKFSGTVGPAPVPVAGLRVAVQAKDRSRWYTVKHVRSDGNGNWQFLYAFKRSKGVVNYPFRVIFGGEHDFFYGRARSREVIVRVFGH
jgi:hypothetical protein